jgi:hypothetical protein
MRNIIKLSEKEVLALLCDYDVQVEIEHEVIEDNIIRTDYEDGGGHHEYIIKNIKKFKKLSFFTINLILYLLLVNSTLDRF